MTACQDAGTYASCAVADGHSSRPPWWIVRESARGNRPAPHAWSAAI